MSKTRGEMILEALYNHTRLTVLGVPFEHQPQWLREGAEQAAREYDKARAQLPEDVEAFVAEQEQGIVTGFPLSRADVVERLVAIVREMGAQFVTKEAECREIYAELVEVRKKHEESYIGWSQCMKDRDDARDWVRRLTHETRILTCAFCGDAYPPNTPESNDSALTAHVKVCAKHPMREVEKESDALRERIAKLEAATRGIMAEVDELPTVPSNQQCQRAIFKMSPHFATLSVLLNDSAKGGA